MAIEMLSLISGMPKASRTCPVSLSVPTRPMVSPMKSAVRPRVIEPPKAAETVRKDSTISAKYSAVPKESATITMKGATSARPIVAKVPPKNDPMAAAPSALPPRPSLAMRLPSSAVMIDAVSPGVLSRIDEIAPPYMPP
jgi:hypothetical protein